MRDRDPVSCWTICGGIWLFALTFGGLCLILWALIVAAASGRPM